MKGKDELEGTRSNFTPWLRDFEHPGENYLGGCCNPLFGELGLTLKEPGFLDPSHSRGGGFRPPKISETD